MEEDNTNLDRTDTSQKASDTMPNWMFRSVLGLLLLAGAYLLLWHGVKVFTFITDRLPLLLPLAVTAMSIATRATEMKSYEAVLRTSNDIAIGIISFDIWLLSARSETLGRALVNPITMIRSEFVLAFLVIGIVTAVGCLVLTHYEFQNPRATQRGLLVGFLVAVLVYIAPFGVLEEVPPPKPAGLARATIRQYTVAIPYQDPNMFDIAPTFLKSRFFVRFEKSIDATSIESARAVAVQRFLSSPDSDRVKPKGKPKIAEKIEIDQKEMLVVER